MESVSAGKEWRDNKYIGNTENLRNNDDKQRIPEGLDSDAGH